MPGNYTFFSGSSLFQPVADHLGLGVDQINFVACQMISLPASLVLYHVLSSRRVSRTIRLVFHIAIGFSICFFCFGSAMKHLIWDAMLNYAIMRWGPSRYAHRLVFLAAMGYLSWIHIYRAYLTPTYRIDITGPMMILTQKLTSLAFSIHDGKVKTASELTQIQKMERVERIPNLLEFFSYIFAYQGILCGPSCFYSDFIAFIEGKHTSKGIKKNHHERPNIGSNELLYVEPTPWQAVKEKVVHSLSFLLLNIVLMPYFPTEAIFDPNRGFLNLLGYLFVYLFLVRAQYYYAWIFSDLIYNASGFGFNGFSSNGRARWDLISNVKVWDFEMATSWKECLEAWNCSTLYWLRRVAYERVTPRYRTVATYVLSAWWHGFFPGYYFTFLTGAIFTVTARTVRRHVRPYVLDSESHKRMYDVLTSLAVKLAVVYAAIPFVLLHLGPAWIVYCRLYFFMHIASLFLLVAIPRLVPKKQQPKKME